MNEKKQSIKYHEIIKRWGNKNFSASFSMRLDDWLAQFTENEKPLMLKLLSCFFYYTENAIYKKVVLLKDKFTEKFPIEESSIIYVQIEKELGVGFSDIFFNAFWLKNSLYARSEKNLLALLNANQIPNMIAIVDDYSGSGDTLIKYLNKILSITNQIKIFFLTLHISECAIENLKQFSIDNHLEIEIIFLDKSSKAFELNYIFDKIDCSEKKEEYLAICDRVKVSDFKLGYKEVESLVSFYYNTPNDTLGIFYHHIVDDFINLFKREDKTGILRNMQIAAKQRKNINKAKPFIYGVSDYKLSQFLVYCVAWGKNLSIANACVDFGLNDEQLDNMIKYMFDESLIVFKDGKICASGKLEQLMFKTRIKEYKKISKELEVQGKIPLKETAYIPLDFETRFKGYKK